MSDKLSKRYGTKSGRFVMLTHDMLDSPAWQALDTVARCTWIEIHRRYNGINNGEISLSCREVAYSLSVSKDTAARALNSLLEKGFIKIARDSAFNVKHRMARTWILTNENCGKSLPTKDWKKWK